MDTAPPDTIRAQVITDAASPLATVADVLPDGRVTVAFDAPAGATVYGYRLELAPDRWSPPFLFPQPMHSTGGRCTFTLRGRPASVAANATT